MVSTYPTTFRNIISSPQGLEIRKMEAALLLFGAPKIKFSARNNMVDVPAVTTPITPIHSFRKQAREVVFQLIECAAYQFRRLQAFARIPVLQCHRYSTCERRTNTAIGFRASPLFDSLHGNRIVFYPSNVLLSHLSLIPMSPCTLVGLNPETVSPLVGPSPRSVIRTVAMPPIPNVYRTSRLLRSALRKNTFTILLVVPFIVSVFFSEFLNGMTGNVIKSL